MNHASHAPQHGFTMVVISALFIAFAVMAAAVVERNTTIQQITRRDATVAQLNKLANAIIEYSVFNKSGTSNRYPCPAALDLPTTDANFGAGLNAAGVPNCYDIPSLPGAETAPRVNVSRFGNLLVGMVPVQTLSQYGIGINDAFDPWNNRIVYVVNLTMTPGGTPSQTAPATATITHPWGAGYAIPAPDFILISLGKDGLGATKRNAIQPAIACPAVTENMHKNCNFAAGGDADFYIAPTYTAANATPATYFDDILTYYRQ